MCEADLCDFIQRMEASAPMEDSAVQIATSLSELQEVVKTLDNSVENADNIKQMTEELIAQVRTDVDSMPSPQWRSHHNALNAALGKLAAAAHACPSVFMHTNKYAMALKAQWVIDEPRVITAEQADATPADATPADATRSTAVEANTDAKSIVLNLDAAFDGAAPTGDKKTKVDGAATGDKKTKDVAAPIIIDEMNEDNLASHDEPSKYNRQERGDEVSITNAVQAPASRRRASDLIAFLDKHSPGGREHVNGDGFCADYSMLGAVSTLRFERAPPCCSPLTSACSNLDPNSSISSSTDPRKPLPTWIASG